MRETKELLDCVGEFSAMVIVVTTLFFTSPVWILPWFGYKRLRRSI